MEITCTRNEMKNTRKRKKILVTGGGGFIGSNFLEFVAQKKLDYDILSPSHAELDIQNKTLVKDFFNKYKLSMVVNFAAHRNANTAEEQRGNKNGSAWKTNVTGVGNLSEISERFGNFFIHISTDMVFSGLKNNRGPYDEISKRERYLENLSWYGWTKAHAERILEKNKNSAIIRIGNVTKPIYDPALDYIGKILYLFDQGKLYPLFDDQYITLTYIPSIFEVIEILIEKKIAGVFHVSSSNVVTPYELATYLIEKVRGRKEAIKKISIDSYLRKFPNRYPKFGGLLSKKTGRKLGIEVKTWQDIVKIFQKNIE